MDLLQVCKDLIAIPSISGQAAAVDKVIGYCQHLFDATGAVVKVFRWPGVSPVLYIANRQTAVPDVAVVGHLDVVPAETAQFTPKEENGRLYGRGALDMKSFAAVAFGTMMKVMTQKTAPSFAIVLETDEEIGSQGMQHFMQAWPEFVPKVVLDVDVGGDISQMIDQCKCPAFVRLTAVGQAAHGSTPWEGTDANERIFRTLARLRQKYPYYAADVNVPENKWVNTMHVGKITGGSATNIVSDTCMAEVDFRLVPTEKTEKLFADIKASCDAGVGFEVISLGTPVVIRQDNRAVQQYKKIAEQVLGHPVAFTQIGGATTSRLFHEKGATIIYHAGSGDGMHGADEYVDIQSLYDIATIQEQFLAQMTL